MSELFSRRMFLCGAVATPFVMPPSAGPHLVFPSEPKKRLAVTSYPFRAYIESPTNPARDKSVPGMDLKAFAGMVATRFGVHNINPVGEHLRATDADYLKAFREAAAAADSHLVDLGVGGRDFGSTDAAVRDDAVAHAKRWIDVAVAIGSPSIRPHLKTTQGMTPNVASTVESLQRVADYGALKDVVVNLENDSPGAEDPFFIVEVLEKVNSPYLRALADFGNSLRGHDAAYNQKAVDGMFRHAYNMSHVKDVLRTKDGQVYKVDVAGMFGVARARNYKGYFSMEFDTAAGDAFAGTDNLVKQSLEFM